MLIYRGPLERSRLRFASKVLAASGDLDPMVWLVPKPNNKAATAASNFEDSLGRRIRLIDGRYTQALAVRQLLTRETAGGSSVHVMGLSAVPFIPALSCSTVWWLNGVPEERYEYQPTRRNRVKAQIDWAVLAAKLRHRRTVLVVVSAPMGALYASKLPNATVVVAPCTVDRKLFAMDPSWRSSSEGQKIVCGYAGSGAPWQQVPQMASLWSELARLAPERYAFRVVTRDARVHAEIERVAPNLEYERQHAEEPTDVARHLSGCAAGFVLRDRSTTNLCAYPTKFGEYLACGLHVITTDIGWEPGELVRRHGAGVLLDPLAPPTEQAKVVDRHLRSGSANHQIPLRAAADLDEDAWAAVVADNLAAVRCRG